MRSGPKMSCRRVSFGPTSTSADFGVRAPSPRGSTASPTIGPSANAAAGLSAGSTPSPARWRRSRPTSATTGRRWHGCAVRWSGCDPEERALVTLFYEEERSVAEIAQIMDLSLSNVKVRLHRLRGRLRGYMEEKRMNDERLAELIRAAAPRREAPVGLETRIMAQVALRDRRRRERRAIAAMACYCAVTAAAVAVVALRLSAVGRLAGGDAARCGGSGGRRGGDGDRLRRPRDGNFTQTVTFFRRSDPIGKPNH